MKMMTKQERIDLLLAHDDATWHWRYWGLFFNLIVVAFISYQTSIYLPLIVFALYLPQLCVEWRKTKLLLSFNPESRYRRWVYADYAVQWFAFLIVLCALACYHTGVINIWTLVTILSGGMIGGLLFPYMVNRVVLTFDTHHVTNRMFNEAKTERHTHQKTSS